MLELLNQLDARNNNSEAIISSGKMVNRLMLGGLSISGLLMHVTRTKRKDMYHESNSK